MRMSFSVFFLFICCFLSACHQEQKDNSHRISMEFTEGIQVDSIKMVSYNNSEVILAKTGQPYQFNFSAPINDAYVIDVFKNGNKASQKIFLDGTDLKIQAKFISNTFTIDTVVGSKTYAKTLDFYKTLEELELNKASDSVMNKFLLQHVKDNLNHPFSLEISHIYIEKNKNYKPQLLGLITVLQAQPEALKVHPLSVDKTLNELIKEEYIDLSAFQVYDKSGTISTIDLSHKGDYLLDFWFVQCPPCVRDHKKIGSNLELFTDNNVELIGVSIDTESDKWLSYLEKNNYNWKNYRELRKGNDLVDALDVWEFPTYILIDAKGKIKTKFYSYEALESYYSKA